MFYKGVALSLMLIMIFVCCFMNFMSTSTANADALNEEEILESYLTNSDIAEEYIEEISSEIEDTYSKFLKHDSDGRLLLDVNSISEEYYNEGTVDMISTNISIMNELVDEGVALINENSELEIIDEDFAQQWAYWGFSISWNKLCIKFDKDVALVFGFFFLTVAIYSNFSSVASIANYMANMDGSAQYSMISAIILDATAMLPADIGSGIVGYISNSWILSYLANILPIFLGAVSSANILGRVFAIILPIILPSIVDCVIIIYNALKYNKGVEIKICWIPWFGDKWGLSLKSI